MSHDIVLVFLRPEADLEETLAPFNEHDEKYMKFVDKTDDVKEAFDKLPDSCPSEGTYIEEIDRTDLVNNIWDNAIDEPEEGNEEKFWVPYTKKEYPTPADIAMDKGYDVIPDETKRDGVRFVQRVERNWAHQASKEKYPTLDAYAKGYYGYERVNGRYGYFSNPNAKYDYYIEGGRWDGYLTNSVGAKTNREMLMEVDWEKTNVPSRFVNADGEWCEKDKLGLFGITTNKKPKKDWNAEFKDYVRTLIADEEAEEIQVVVINFHI